MTPTSCNVMQLLPGDLFGYSPVIKPNSGCKMVIARTNSILYYMYINNSLYTKTDYIYTSYIDDLIVGNHIFYVYSN